MSEEKGHSVLVSGNANKQGTNAAADELQRKLEQQGSDPTEIAEEFEKLKPQVGAESLEEELSTSGPQKKEGVTKLTKNTTGSTLDEKEDKKTEEGKDTLKNSLCPDTIAEIKSAASLLEGGNTIFKFEHRDNLGTTNPPPGQDAEEVKKRFEEKDKSSSQ